MLLDAAKFTSEPVPPQQLDGAERATVLDTSLWDADQGGVRRLKSSVVSQVAPQTHSSTTRKQPCRPLAGNSMPA